MIYTPQPGRIIRIPGGGGLAIPPPILQTITSWWLSGGISAANCVAAYQPKGAASLAASYSNLANPGTYDAAPGTAPTFDTSTGWTFASASSQYLTTGITPTNDQSWSAIVRFSNAGVSGNAMGYFTTTTSSHGFFLRPRHDGTRRGYANGAELFVSGTATAGVMAIAGATAYFDGSSDGAISTAAGTFGALYIGAANFSNPRYFDGNIQALAIYNTALTGPQVSALSTAMAAL